MAVSLLGWKPLESKPQDCLLWVPTMPSTRPGPWEFSRKYCGNARVLFFSLQEDILEELLNDMALVPTPSEGCSSLAVTPEHPPQLLLSPNLDIPAPYPNSEPPENPLKQLLVPKEGECQLWGDRDWGLGDRPPYTLSISPPLHITAVAAQSGNLR